ncbi:MAG: hypothetical protein M3347_08615 [Armatimonadota bacterium]|nr:hypothetical protein [Armatimonadota bacterium]
MKSHQCQKSKRVLRLPASLMLALFLWSSAGMRAVVWAQPSDARIIKDLTKPGVLSVKLSEKGGGKVWSKNDLQYYWERGAVVIRDANVAGAPDVKLEIGGIATYTIVGGQYTFKRFYVTWNRYEGIPNPTEKEIMGIVKSDIRKFLGDYHYNKIVGDIEEIKLADDPKWNWHTPNSVSFEMETRHREITNNTTIEKVEQSYEVRLYRDAVKGPWKNFISTPKERKVLSQSTHRADEITAMKTFGMLDQEKQATADLKKLPDVEVPEFKKDVELFLFTHKMRREATPEAFEA